MKRRSVGPRPMKQWIQRRRKRHPQPPELVEALDYLPRQEEFLS